MSSWLDRLQSDAHARELEPKNTSPGTFLALALCQIPVIYLISTAISTRFQTAAALCLGSHWFGFAIARVLGTDKLFDITEDVSYFLVILWLYRTIEQPSLRQTIVFALGMLWCVRICCFVGYRIMVRGHDWRFDKLSTAKCYSLFSWTCGGTWCWLNGFSMWVLADRTANAKVDLGVLDAIGLAVCVTGFLVELIADIQKYKFNSAFAYDKNTEWIASGLWSLSRHPNYCGEIMIWIGISLVCLSNLQDVGVVDGLLIAVTPMWSAFFLLFTSLMLLEKRADAKWGNIAAYQDYKRITPVLFPGM